MPRFANLGDLVRRELDLGKTAIIDRRPPQPGDVPITFADVSKARERLEYRPRVPIETGVGLLVDWLRRSQDP